MRSLTAASDAKGRSSIVKEVEYHHEDISPEGEGRLSAGHPTRSSRADIFVTSEAPPPPAPATAPFHDVELKPGQVALWVLMIPPNGEHPHHHTASLNFHTVVAGDVDLILDDGPHHLDLGDTLVLPGVNHGWKAGPTGCTMSIVVTGTERYSA